MSVCLSVWAYSFSQFLQGNCQHLLRSLPQRLISQTVASTTFIRVPTFKQKQNKKTNYVSLRVIGSWRFNTANKRHYCLPSHNRIPVQYCHIFTTCLTENKFSISQAYMMKVIVSWYVTSSSLVDMCRHFGGIWNIMLLYGLQITQPTVRQHVPPKRRYMYLPPYTASHITRQ